MSVSSKNRSWPFSLWPFVVLVLAACTGSISVGFDRDAEADADADADVDGDSDGDGDADGDISDEPIDPTVQEVVDTIDRVNELLCECSWEAHGYDSAEECAGDSRTFPEVLRCFSRAYREHEDGLQAYYTCRIGVDQEWVECIEESECEAELNQECESSRGESLAECPEREADEYAAFEERYVTCATGDRSGCPDEALTDDLPRVSGDTRGEGNDLRGSCGGRRGADLAYRWAAPFSGTFAMDTTGSGFDTVLYVVTDCAASTELDCNDDIDHASGNRASRVEVELDAGSEVIIVIDGWDVGDSGEFQLRITET